MGFFSDLFGSKPSVPALAPQWASFGRGATRRFLSASFKEGKRERKRQIGLAKDFYQTRKKSVTKIFEKQLKFLRRDISRDAGARGLGKSTMALGLAPTGELALRQQQALGDLRAQHIETLAGIKPTNTALYKYMREKNRLGALEPYWLSGFQQRGSSPFGRIAGGAIGGFFGGPAGAAIGGQIGGGF